MIEHYVNLISKQRILGNKGFVQKVLASDEESFAGFGEAYLSSVKYGEVKGWKRHKRMLCNLFVVSGRVRFYFASSPSFGDLWHEIELSCENGQLLSVKPGIWFAFEGRASEQSVLLNIANIKHDESEVDRKDLNEFRGKL